MVDEWTCPLLTLSGFRGGERARLVPCLRFRVCSVVDEWTCPLLTLRVCVEVNERDLSLAYAFGFAWR